MNMKRSEGVRTSLQDAPKIKCETFYAKLRASNLTSTVCFEGAQGNLALAV